MFVIPMLEQWVPLYPSCDKLAIMQGRENLAIAGILERSLIYSCLFGWVRENLQGFQGGGESRPALARSLMLSIQRTYSPAHCPR